MTAPQIARTDSEKLIFQAGLLDAVQQSVIVTDLDRTITYWNHFAETLYGWSSVEALGRNLGELIVPEASEAASQDSMPRLLHGETWSGEFVVRRRDGTSFPCLVTDSPLRDSSGELTGVIGVSIDNSARHLVDAALVHQAVHDALTGLPNRAQMHTRLQQVLASGQGPAPPVALLLLDLDRFKEVNDTLGHHVGDQLLQQTGQRLQGVVRSADLVARLGGDEFGVLLPNTDATGAALVADVLTRILQAPFVLEGQPISVDASIGIAVAPDHGLDADALLRCADVAMYSAKRSGTGVAVYSASNDEHSAERLALLGELRYAIDHDELRLHYQPKLDLRDGRLVGVEALVRWQHPQRGFLPPNDFIPLAEQTGLIYPLTRWVLDAALKQQQAWGTAGIVDVPVAVNLSRRSLHDPKLPERVAAALAHWHVSPGALVVEITESSLMAEPERAAENLKQLRALGVRISIDDFGTGYSSMASLKNLPVDELKIDQSFVQAMATDASSRAIVRAIIDLGDALNLRVVAEGIEDRATWDVVAGLGCDIAQGYFVSRPIDSVALERWVRTLSPSWLKVAENTRLKDALQARMRGRGARLTAEEEFVARKQAEAALLASEERNRLALQAAHMGTWDYDVIHDVRSWSPETQALYGLPPGPLDQPIASFEPVVHPDDWPALKEQMQTFERERRDSITTYRTLWPDGSVHWLENRNRPIFDADGTLVRVTGTSMDVTERKVSEAKLRASEERTHLALGAARVGTWDWDALHDVTTFSVETEALHGLAPGTFEGTTAAFRCTIHPDDWPTYNARMLAAIAEHGELFVTYRSIWGDGSVHWLEGKGRGLYAADGGITRMIGTVMDITERKTAEARDRLLTTALEASANAVVLTDRAGCVEWANPAFTKLTGYPLSEMQGQNPRLLKSGRQSADFYRNLWDTIVAGNTWHAELVNRRKDGSLYTEEMTITPVRDDTGEIAHFVAIKQDVTLR